VTGRPIAVPVTRGERYQLLDALGRMTVIVKADGVEVDRGKGSDVLDHPLNAVVWLAQDLRRHGLAMKPGDVISLGSFSRLMPPKAGQKVEVEYWGLPEARSVSVSFK
jgi:2-keto-4-pentenoate hydratase